jgi:hypothetical protein
MKRFILGCLIFAAAFTLCDFIPEFRGMSWWKQTLIGLIFILASCINEALEEKEL